MKLEDQDIDTVHQLACAEFADDPEATLLLNQNYEALLTILINVLRFLRGRPPREH